MVAGRSAERRTCSRLGPGRVPPYMFREADRVRQESSLNPLTPKDEQGCRERVLRPPERYVQDEGLRQRGIFGSTCFFLVVEAERAGCRNAATFVEVLHTIDRELCLGAWTGD